jgi:two-component system cell cycle sensor histidine kinase/response regulator CckA
MSDVEQELRREIAALRLQLQQTAAPGDLRSEQTLLRAVFDCSLDAMLLADDHGVYVDANPAACEIFGLPRDQLIGKNVTDFAPRELGTAELFQSFVGTGRMRGQFPLRRPDGTRRVLEFSAVANIAPGLHLSALRDITDRVVAEDALRRSEVRFRAMIEKGHDGISLLSADVRTLYQSPAVERLLGYTPEEAAQIRWQDFVDEEERPKLARALAVLMKGPGATAAVEFRIRRRDGALRWLELTATNRLEDRDVGAIVANFRDITERKMLEEEREGFFQLSLDLLCVAGADGRFRRLNPAWQTTLGWSLDELCAREWLDLVHPDDREATAREGARLAEGRVVVRFENRYRCKDGSYRWLQWASIPTSNGIIYACAHDVTAERATAERDRLLFMASPLPMLLVDATTFRLLDANDACVREYGYPRDELLSLTLNDLVVEEQRQGLVGALAELAETGTIFVSNRQHLTKSGERRRVQVTSHRLNVGGREAILKVIVDITEMKRLEEERARYVERLRLLELSVSRLNDIVIITKASPLSESGPEIVFVNEAFERITGYSPQEVIGRTPRILQGPESDPSTLARLRHALERAEPVREEIVNYTKAGVPYWVELDVAAVRNDAGELTHFVAVERDITEQRRARLALKRSEDQLRQAQKMEAIGSLASGIAHDFNNLLTVILSYTSLIMEDLPAADPMRENLDEVHRAGLRATEMTRQLLAFSRKQMLQPSAVDVSVVVRGIEKMLRRMVREDIELRLQLLPDAGRAFVDPSQLEQVIMNLVVNARDAMPGGGNITVETSSVVLDDAYAASHAGVAPGVYVLLTVTDTGIGMDRATQDRVFEPFFTTKEVGKGTGLGLSTVYGIVAQSGGHIWLYSELGRGTTFKVYLPRTDRVTEAATDVQPLASLRGSETILLVEDEAPVRDVVRSILGKSGYHVLEAQNAGDALLICEQFKARIHLLLTDIVMPRMSGRDLAERLTRTRPEMRVLFVSGYTEDTIIHQGVLDAGVDFLPKPILPEPLLRKLRQVLDGRSRRTTSISAG